MYITRHHAERNGFTLLELLVVLGIIAILLAAIMPMMGRIRDGSLTAKCKNNMKNIVQGAISYAQGRSENDGHFPSAGFYRSIDLKKSNRRPFYYPQKSWISNKGDVSQLNRSMTSPFIGSPAHFTDPDNLERITCITNGAIWQSSGRSFEVYRCPIHETNYEKKNKEKPGWSYVMNQEFGFNRDEKGTIGFFGGRFGQNITVATDSAGERTKSASRSPDKVLMFAEVQGADITDKKHGITLKALVSGSGTETDAILQYANEEIGFNHPVGKGKYGGNVAFADGHVDTIIMPTSMSRKDLTRYLCQGFDVPHDGRSYTPNADDEK